MALLHNETFEMLVMAQYNIAKHGGVEALTLQIRCREYGLYLDYTFGVMIILIILLIILIILLKMLAGLNVIILGMFFF